jgi:parallel beta-helix repeat protein
VKRTLVVVGLATSLVVASSPTAAQAATTTFYVDCSATSNGDGTQSTPWNSTAAVNTHSGGYAAGNQILLKAGTTCTGALAPPGSGSSGSPITVGAYGSGNKPVVKAASGQESAISLTNQSYWTVTGLDFSGGTRHSVFVTVTTGVASGIILQNLNVHDVTGGTLNSKDTGLVVVAPTHNTTNSTSARFDTVLIDGVVAHDTTMWAGILVGTGQDADSWASTESKRSKNVTVRNSTVYNVYGDGIVLFAVNNGLLDNNVAHDTGIQPSQTIGTPNGIWSWACNTCTVQRNEVYRANSPGTDGGAFDIDYFSLNTTVQYNYGHDNSSYCVAVFGANSYTTDTAVIRYNICAHNGTESGTIQEEIYLAVWNSGHINGVKIYGNTFVTAHGVMYAANYNGSGSIWSGSAARTYNNNIVYATTSNPYGSGGDGSVATPALTSDYNVWYSTAGAWTNSEAHSIYANPQLTDPTHTGNGDPGTAYNLKSTSPAINTGTTISSSGGRDYRGTSVPQGGAYDIGALEYTG